jgi:hypothetical protein
MPDIDLEDYLSEVAEDAIKESDLSQIIQKKAVEAIQRALTDCLKDVWLGVEYNHTTEEIEMTAFLSVNDGEAQVLKRVPITETFEYGSFFDGIDDGNDSASKSGEFFQKIADKCFEIDKEWKES